MAQPEPWAVLVLRGWVDAGHLRVRLLRTGSTGTDDRTAASAASAAHIVEDWLDELARRRRNNDGAPDKASDTAADGDFLGSGAEPTGGPDERDRDDR